MRSETGSETEKAKMRDLGQKTAAQKNIVKMELMVRVLPALRTIEAEEKTPGPMPTYLSAPPWHSTNPTCITCMDILLDKATIPAILDTEACPPS